MTVWSSLFSFGAERTKIYYCLTLLGLDWFAACSIGFLLCVSLSCKIFLLTKLSLSENLQQVVVNQFSRVAQHQRCSFFGNVTLGLSISLAELRELYDVVSFLLKLFLYFFFGNGILVQTYVTSVICVQVGCACLWCRK